MKIEFGSLACTLFVVFLVLKLTKVIAWSWLWVMAPLWAGVALAVSIWLLVTLIGLAAILLSPPRGR